MSWSKRSGYAAVTLLAATVAGAVLLRRRRTEVWHTLPTIDQN